MASFKKLSFIEIEWNHINKLFLTIRKNVTDKCFFLYIYFFPSYISFIISSLIRFHFIQNISSTYKGKLYIW